ncbi:MAG: sulfite exporter TauE/SafE family protein [Lachnospiraceae bacterium]|nr:sulfite exporter TauE/SafE family protein [Lachnospiraceae bacterium]
MIVFLILLLNLLVGACVGLTGIAGFLLPMFYTGFLGLRASEALALSFSAFLISGILGSINYFRAGNLDLHSGLILSAGSLIGAVFGVRINLLIPEHIVQMILYLVVLISGISILLRRDAPSKVTHKKRTGSKINLLYVLLGIITGSICAASGAGGPVLVMPLLTVIGFPVHTAVGVALFNSIFIALVAASGYLLNASFTHELWLLFPWILIVHGIGVLYGSKNAARINQKVLKRIVAVASILIALFKLL